MFGWHHEDTERKMVPVSTNLFPIAATAFLVGLAVVFVVFTVKYIGGRVGGRGPLGLFSHPAARTLSTTTTKRATVRRTDTEGGVAQTGGYFGDEDGEKSR